MRALFIKFRFRDDVVGRRHAFSKNASAHCAMMNRVFDVRVSVKGKPYAGSSFLYIGNHTGFVDIFSLCSVMPAVFVTSQEMREAPLLGALCEMAGCIFVERRSRTKIMGELGVLREALEQDLNIVLYPEATSTDGARVYPFKKTLMMAASQVGRPIQPGCVNYVDIGGQDFNMNSRDSVCWYGEMSFVRAMWNLATTHYVKVEVQFLEPLHFAKDTERSHIAAATHAVVSAHYRPPRPIAAVVESVTTGDEASNT